MDDLQGQEERVIFISTVLSNPESLPPRSAVRGPDGRLGDLQVGFWRNPRRFNVAITRAKALLVVLGHPVTLLEVLTGPASDESHGHTQQTIVSADIPFFHL